LETAHLGHKPVENDEINGLGLGLEGILQNLLRLESRLGARGLETAQLE
jgi:hypothetical protein